MRVKDFMKTNVIAVPSNTSIYDALKIMKENNIKRMPIVDNGKLVGIVTRRGLKEATPSKATTLSIYELNYLLSKMTVKDVMRKKVITIPPDFSFEAAAYTMHKYQIGGLPVVEDKKLVGFVTSNDLFQVMVHMNGLEMEASRITVEVDEDKSNEAFVKLAEIVIKHGADLRLMSVMNLPQYLHKKHIIIRSAVTEEVNKIVDDVKANGYNVVSVLEKTRFV
jgi:acetoin utilization protein AcuB